MPGTSRITGHTANEFPGFEHLSANYIYCPNQFFEVCLRHYSRGVVRLVAYMLRTTLGHLDKNGDPVKQDIRIPYSEISKYAGLSTRAIPGALDQAESGGFLLCVTRGVANARGRRGQAAEYRLRWSGKGTKYTDDPTQFNGFYAGDGRRSPIPNGYFDVVLRQETLAMAKVVGTVLRHTVGYQNQFGGRRSEAPLPYSYIQQFANIRDRTTLSETLKAGMKKGYICCVSAGFFDPHAGKQSRAASYAIKWLEKAMNSRGTANILPEESEDGKNLTGRTANILPEKDGKNPTDRKTVPKDSDKQQDVVAENLESYALLVGEGINRNTAIKLSGMVTFGVIKNQIDWLDFRNPENRPAMLRKSIEEGWEQPVAARRQNQRAQSRHQEQEQDVEKRAEEERGHEQRHRRRADLLERWKKQSRKQQQQFYKHTIEQATSASTRRRLIRNRDLNNPATEVLECIALECAVPIGMSA